MSIFLRNEGGEKAPNSATLQNYQLQQQQQDDSDKVWFYQFDQDTLSIEEYVKKNKETSPMNYDNSFIMIYYVEQFQTTLSEFKKGKINDFKNQKAELEKDKERGEPSYHYETMITHVLENLDFFLRNEINMIQIKQYFQNDKEKKDEYDKKEKHNLDREKTSEIDFVYQKIIRQEEGFLKKCQDYIAIEKLYCNEFWKFQSEKQRYYRYICTCVRLFFFFYEYAAYQNIKSKYYKTIYEKIPLTESAKMEIQQNKDDITNLYQHSYNESKYCLCQVTKNYKENDMSTLGLNLLTMLLKQLLTSEFDQIKPFILQKLEFPSLIAEFKDVIQQSHNKANDIINNQQKELELVKIVKEKDGDSTYPAIYHIKEVPMKDLNSKQEEEDKKQQKEEEERNVEPGIRINNY